MIALPDRPLHRRALLASARDLLLNVVGRLFFHAQLSRALSDAARPLLILHPQTLGFRLTTEIVERRRAPAALYLLDSSFFCIRSYNHIPGEAGPCLRCIGGDFAQASQNGCLPYPKPDPYATTYVQRLRKYVTEGRLVLIAQASRQAELAFQHFKLRSMPAVVGLWTADWDSILVDHDRAPATSGGWDVVFHGFNLAPKGADWLEELAARMPTRRFLFPYPPPRKRRSANCEYRPMTWESGLDAAMRSSTITVVPSLWSAPIEGALVKSIAVAGAAAVVENRSAYADELPNGLVLRLPKDAGAAAAVLEEALRSGWQPDADVKRAWLDELRLLRENFLNRLIASVPGTSARLN